VGVGGGGGEEGSSQGEATVLLAQEVLGELSRQGEVPEEKASRGRRERMVGRRAAWHQARRLGGRVNRDARRSANGPARPAVSRPTEMQQAQPCENVQQNVAGDPECHAGRTIWFEMRPGVRLLALPLSSPPVSSTNLFTPEVVVSGTLPSPAVWWSFHFNVRCFHPPRGMMPCRAARMPSLKHRVLSPQEVLLHVHEFPTPPYSIC